MFKSLQDLFKNPPPTTYEIEAGEEVKRTGVMTTAGAPYFAREERMNTNRKRKDRSADNETDQANDAKRRDTKAVPKDKSYIPLSPDYERLYASPDYGRTYDSPDYGKTDYGISSYLPDYVPTYDSPHYGRTGDLSDYDSPVYEKTYGTPYYGKTNDSPAYVRTPSPIAQILPPIVKAEPIDYDLSTISNKQGQFNYNINTYSPDNEMGTKAKDSRLNCKTIIPTQELNKVTQQPTKATNTYASPLDIIIQSVQEEKNKNTAKPVSLHPSSTTPLNAIILPAINNSNTKDTNTFIPPLDIILQSVQEEKNKNTPKPVSLHSSSTTPPPTNNSPIKATNTYVSPLDIIIQSVQEEKNKNTLKPVSLHSSSTTPPPTNSSPIKATNTYVSPLDIIIQSVQEEKSKNPPMPVSLPSDSASQFTTTPPPNSNSPSNNAPTSSTEQSLQFAKSVVHSDNKTKKKPGRRARLKKQKQKQVEEKERIKKYHLDRHYNRTDPVDKKESDLFNEFKQLKAKKKREAQSSSTPIETRTITPVKPPATTPPPPKKSTVVCKFFKVGACTQFEDCPYAHDLKLEPCRFFHMSGHCEHEDKCPYSHEPLNDDMLKRLRKLTGPCRYYNFKGYCNNPEKCKFSHEEYSEEELKQVGSSIQPCRYFHLFKNCKKGDECFYLHEEATPQQVEELIAAQKKV